MGTNMRRSQSMGNPGNAPTLKMFPSRSITPESLPEKSLLCGKGKSTSSGNPLQRLSERRLVRKISSSLRVAPRGDTLDEDFSSVSVTSTSAGAYTNTKCSQAPFRRAHTTTCASTTTRPNDLIEILAVSDLEASDTESCASLPDTSSEDCSPCQRDVLTPSLHRKELIVSDLLGVGTFSQVFALKGLELQCDYDRMAADPQARYQLEQQTYCQQQKLVVKHLNRKLLQRPKQFFQAALHLEREATILGQIQHPHIVRLRGVAIGGTHALQSGRYNDYFLVLDRLEDSLDARIEQWKRNKAPPASLITQQLQYGLELASALSYLHERRLLYRDCKPQNVGFLAANDQEGEKSGALQLFDFGFCRSLPASTMDSATGSDEEETFRMSLAGTTRYMAPEVMLHQPYNAKADVYSWALTMYEMVSLQKPYADLKANSFAEMVGHQGVRPRLSDSDSFSVALQRLLEQAWAASVPDRLSMAAVVDRLQFLLVAAQQSTQ